MTGPRMCKFSRDKSLDYFLDPANFEDSTLTIHKEEEKIPEPPIFYNSISKPTIETNLQDNFDSYKSPVMSTLRDGFETPEDIDRALNNYRN